MYTDGLDEGINTDHEEFGYERIREVFETNDDVLNSLYNSLISFAGDEEQFDDITMLLLSVESNERFIFRDPDYSVITVFCDTLEDRLSHFDTEKSSELKMVTDEILNNCISYGLGGIKDPVIISDLTISKHQVQMTFSDNGVPFNPLTVKPDPGRSFFDRDKGGFGISFIKQFSDSQRYERLDGWNRLYILKKMEKTSDTETKE